MKISRIVNTILFLCLIGVVSTGVYYYAMWHKLELANKPNQIVHQNNIITPTPSPTPRPTPKPRKQLDGGYLFNLVNNYRAKQGLSQMTWWHQLCEYSKSRSTQIKTDWSHDGYYQDSKNGELYQDICPECQKTGENLAKDYWTEEAILQAWINSPTHKANLDDPSWNVGCAMVYQNNYVSFEFGQVQK